MNDEQEAVERLSAVAWKRWFDEEKVVDDITIIVVFLGREEEQLDKIVSFMYLVGCLLHEVNG